MMKRTVSYLITASILIPGLALLAGVAWWSQQVTAAVGWQPSTPPTSLAPADQQATSSLDLAVTSIQLAPPNPHTTQPVSVTINVKNVGTESAPGRRIYLYVDPVDQPPTATTPATKEYVTALTWPAGDSMTLGYDEFTFTQSGCGHVIYAWVDPLNRLAESNESNNLQRIDVCVEYEVPGSNADSYEADNECSAAQEIAVDESGQLRNFAPRGDVDWAKFQVTAGVIYTVTATGLGAEAMPTLELTDQCPNSKPPVFGTTTRITFLAPTTGWYYVKAHNDLADGDPFEASYRLKITQAAISSSPPTLTEITPRQADNSQETAVVITGDNFRFPNQAELCSYEANACSNRCRQLRDTSWRNSQQLQAYVPAALDTGLYCVAVTNDDGQRALLPQAFTVLPPPAAPTPTPTPTPPTVNDFDVCQSAGPLANDGVAQAYTFHDKQDEDWFYFDALQYGEYLIQAQTPLGSPADVNLEVYAACADPTIATQEPSFSPIIRLKFVAPTTGRIYLRLRNQADGNDAAYQLSVRQLPVVPKQSAVIIVAGKYQNNDPLQRNIYQVTDAVYNLFLSKGHTAERIFYIAPDTNRLGFDAAATKANLANAITQWALDKVDADRALTIYMMDHGGQGKFYLDNVKGEVVTPAELDGWLTQLQNARPDVPINLIYDACYSGSFIGTGSLLSKPGRVIMTSTSAQQRAFASATGAIFSDHLLSWLRQDASLYNSFQEARWAARAANLQQDAWLDDNGDGIPNGTSDGVLTGQRGFSQAGSFADEDPTVTAWPPFIQAITVPTTLTMTDSTSLTATVLTAASDVVTEVWAVLYPPDYQVEPNSEAMVALPTPIRLTLQSANQYSTRLNNFTASGVYTIVVYARSAAGLEARPAQAQINVNPAAATATPTATPTSTSSVTATPTPTSTATSIAPTPTATSIAPTPTATSIAPTPTATPMQTVTPTETTIPTPTPTATATPMGSATPTATTVTPTSAATATLLPTLTPTVTAPAESTPTATLTPLPTASHTATATATGLATPTGTVTPTSTSPATPTSAATPTATPTRTDPTQVTPTPTGVVIGPTAESTVTTDLETLQTTLTFPPGAVAQSVLVVVAPVATPPAIGGFQVLGQVFTIEATATNGNPVTHFAQPFTLVVTYSDAAVQAIDEQSLTLHYWHEGQQSWIAIPTTVDAANNRLTATLDHLTTFAVLQGAISKPAQIFLPLVRR